MNSDDFINDLKLISYIQNGDTLCVEDRTIINHSSWISTFKRYWYQENRNRTITWVCNVVEKSLKEIHSLSDNEIVFDIHTYINLLNEVKGGILNLTLTYSQDDDAKKRLSSSLTLIDNMIFFLESKIRDTSSIIENSSINQENTSPHIDYNRVIIDRESCNDSLPIGCNPIVIPLSNNNEYYKNLQFNYNYKRENYDELNKIYEDIIDKITNKNSDITESQHLIKEDKQLVVNNILLENSLESENNVEQEKLQEIEIKNSPPKICPYIFKRYKAIYDVFVLSLDIDIISIIDFLYKIDFQ